MAVCPFCRQYIKTDIGIYRQIIANRDTDALKSVLNGKANTIKCPFCNETFYYEHNFLILNSNKNYAIASVPNIRESLDNIKTSLFNILNKQDFKLRLVHEFIYVIEKARIFEFDLDDRVLEIIKYNYIVKPKELGTNAKIILSNTTNSNLEFTMYDELDKPVTHHYVALDSYYKTSTLIKKELITSPTTSWKKIDLNWSEQYTKENLK